MANGSREHFNPTHPIECRRTECTVGMNETCSQHGPNRHRPTVAVAKTDSWIANDSPGLVETSLPRESAGDWH